jgi:hypothetical protein
MICDRTATTSHADGDGDGDGDDDPCTTSLPSLLITQATQLEPYVCLTEITGSQVQIDAFVAQAGAPINISFPEGICPQ